MLCAVHVQKKKSKKVDDEGVMAKEALTYDSPEIRIYVPQDQTRHTHPIASISGNRIRSLCGPVCVSVYVTVDVIERLHKFVSSTPDMTPTDFFSEVRLLQVSQDFDGRVRHRMGRHTATEADNTYICVCACPSRRCGCTWCCVCCLALTSPPSAPTHSKSVSRSSRR